MKTDIKIYTKEEITKANDNILNVDQLNFMFAETPEKHIHKRPGKGGQTWDFVTGTYIKKVLNLMFGWDWDFEVQKFDVNIEAKQVIVLGKLTCRTGEKTITKMQFGRADIKFKRGTLEPLDLGNDLKAATTDALKKCSSELGIASDVYGKNEFKSIKLVESKPTEEQLYMLGDLIEQCNLNDDEEKRVRFTLPTDSMHDVQMKIDNLLILVKEKSIDKQYDLKLRL